MPYEIRNGDEVWHEKGGTWKIKQKCGSHKNAVKAMGLLYALEKNPKMKKSNK